MTPTTIVRMFDTHTAAEAAVRDLEARGFADSEVSIIRPGDTAVRDDTTTETEAASGAGIGATIGAAVGGSAGLLAGIGSLAIPGIGPIVAAGWIVAALAGAGAGAAAGGLVGALTGSGVNAADADVYAEGVRRGAALVTVRADQARIAEADSILSRHGPADIGARREEYRSSGWTATAGVAAGDRMDSRDDPPGTMASRGFDRAAGTNVSGAFPSQSDGTPRNPPDTALGRAARRRI